MRSKLSSTLRSTLSLALLALSAQLCAQDDIGHWYRSDTSTTRPFTDGHIHSNGSGNSLTASSTFRLSETETEQTQIFSHLAPSGSPLWSIASDAPSITFKQDPSSSEHAFAYRFTEQTIEVVRVNGTTLQPTYAISYPLTAAPEKSGITFTATSRVAILQNLGSQQQIAVFDSNGSLVFENKYSAAGFLPLNADEFSTQTACLHSIEGSDRLLITLLKSTRNQSKSTYNNTLFVLSIDDQGHLNWSRSVAIETVSRTIDRSCVIDGQLILALPDTTVGIPGQPFSSVPSTHLALISTNGNLVFSQTLEGFTYTGSPVLKDGSSLLLSGFSPNTSSLFATDAALAQLSATSGEIEKQTGFDAYESERLHLVGLDNANRYAYLTGDSTSAEEPNVFLAIDDLLHTATAKSHPNATLRIDSQSQLYLSAYSVSKAAVGAIPLDSQLNSDIAQEIDLADATFNSVVPQISATNFELTLLDLNVTSQNETSTISPSAISFAHLPLESYRGAPQPIPSPLPLQFKIEANNEATLSFYSEYGIPYSLQSSAHPSDSFETINTQEGTGQKATFQIPLSQIANRFLRVVKQN